MRGVRCNVLLPLLLLGACATTPEKGIKVEYVDRPVITETKCVKVKDIPQRPGSLAASGLPSNVERALSLAMAKVSEWTRYGNKTNEILVSCAREDK